MDIFDWYFKQIVTQSQMDWAFDKVQDSLHATSLDNEFLGIVDGLGTAEHAGTPDKTIDVGGPGTAYDPEGQRCYVSDALTIVDCSQDEFGTDSNPPTATFQRYISVFIRFDRDLTEPALDGNNVVVYTKQLESFELFVRLGAEAAAGTAIPAPLMTDAVLLCDILVTNGFTAILNANIDLSRRQDWVRFTGTVLGDRVYGTSKDAVDDILALIESWGGSLPFSFVSQWFGSVAVAGSTPPPTTIQEALDAIVYDLAQATGIAKVGSADYASTYVSWTGQSGQGALEAIAAAVNGHIGGGAPQHPASSITFTPVGIIAATDVQAAIAEILTDYAATTGGTLIGYAGSGWLTASNVSGALDEIVADLALTTAALSGASRIGTQAISGSPESQAVSDVMDVLDKIYGHLNDRTERATYEVVSGAWRFDNGYSTIQRARSTQNLIFENNPMFRTILGGTVSPFTAPGDIAANVVTEASNWSRPYSGGNEVSLGGGTQVEEICVLFNADGDRRIAVLEAVSGDVFTYDPYDPTVSSSWPVDGDFGAGSWQVVAMCTDGINVYVMGYDTGTTTHRVQAYNAWDGVRVAAWPATGTLLPGTGTTVHGYPQTERIIFGNNTQGATPTLVTVNSWNTCVSAASPCFSGIRSTDGVLLTSGSGDTTFGGTEVYQPCGGIATDGFRIYAAMKDSGAGTKIEVVSALVSNLAAGSGKANLPWSPSLLDDVMSIVSDGESFWAFFRTGAIWIYEYDDENWQSKVDGGTPFGDLKYACFDGLNMWVQNMTAADSALHMVQLPCYSSAPQVALQPVMTKTHAAMYRYDEVIAGPADLPATWPQLGKVCFDGDAINVVMQRPAGMSLAGCIRRIPRAGMR